MQSLADRFRRWYDYEKDCNAKTFEMLMSVPPDRRGTSDFQKAVDRLAHLVAARRLWLARLGETNERPPLFPAGSRLEDLPGLISATENEWTRYLQRLDDRELARELQWQATNGKHYCWNVEGILTQVFGHAWYHRGQIAQLVASLGGKAVDTDYIFWCELAPLDPERA